MRRGYSGYPGQERTALEIGQTHVTIREKSGKVRTAQILDRTINSDTGEITWFLLDRVIHEQYATYQGYEAWGCFVTELTISS